MRKSMDDELPWQQIIEIFQILFVFKSIIASVNVLELHFLMRNHVFNVKEIFRYVEG